jgi:diacylglycerol kinase family enzyme
MKLLVIYNPKSGSADLKAIKKAFTAHTTDVEYVPLSPGLANKITTSRAGAIIAAGGDGTVNVVAQHIIGTTKQLGIIPAGTLNHFAGELGIPADVEAAVKVIADSQTRQIDVGLVNERVFVNNSSIGVYPRSLRIREGYQKSIGKWPAALLGLARSIMRPKHYYVEMRVDGQTHTFRTPFVFIGNNEYLREGLELGERRTLDSGKLAVYIVKAGAPFAIIRSLLSAFLTKQRQTRDFAIYLTDSCTIYTRHNRDLRVACDGETFLMSTPLRYESRHNLLRVIVPTKKRRNP